MDDNLKGADRRLIDAANEIWDNSKSKGRCEAVAIIGSGGDAVLFIHKDCRTQLIERVNRFLDKL